MAHQSRQYFPKRLRQIIQFLPLQIGAAPTEICFSVVMKAT
jgi:hypothetical protein